MTVYTPYVNLTNERPTQRIGLRATQTEAQMLRSLSDWMGLSMADVVRQLIRSEWQRRNSQLLEDRTR